MSIRTAFHLVEAEKAANIGQGAKMEEHLNKAKKNGVVSVDEILRIERTLSVAVTGESRGRTELISEQDNPAMKAFGLVMERAENIAAVSMELHELMLATDDKDWPGAGIRGDKGYRYEVFGGFPGWWSYCSRAALIFDIVFRSYGDEESWIDSAMDYAARVFLATREHMLDISEEEMEMLAHASTI